MSPREEEPLTDEPEDSFERIEAGLIPASAEQRLRERGGSFTSDLSVADFALCHELGLKPLTQVMGSSIYQVGYQGSVWPTMVGGAILAELDTLSAAWNEVRERALARLAEEAAHAGADAVLGVHIRTDEHEFAAGAIEYVVIGTAVSREDTSTGSSASSSGSGPVLSELPVADYSKLVRAGFEPVGIVAHSSVFFVAENYSMQMLGSLNAAQNRELSEFTQGIYSARESVMANVSAQASALGASGVIGVRIAHSIGRISLGGGRYERGGLSVTFHAIGTAIREAGPTTLYAPETTIDLTV